MIKQFLVGGFDENFSYLIINESTKKAAVVDPAGNLSELISFVESNALSVTSILITHGHFDHTEGAPEILKKWNATFFVHTNAEKRINRLPTNTSFINEGEVIPIGELEVTVMHTPGHTDDSVCFHIKNKSDEGAPSIITGDTMFVEGCGRTTEPDAKDLYESLQRLKALDPKTLIYTGHDYGSVPVSTIEQELRNNRFFRSENYEEFFKERFPK